MSEIQEIPTEVHSKSDITSDESLREKPIDQLQNPSTRRKFLGDLASFGLFSSTFGLVGLEGLSLQSRADSSKTEADFVTPGLYKEFSPIHLTNGTELVPIGVKHNSNTFLQNRDQIEQTIEHASIINMEYFSDEMRETSQKWLNSEKGILSDYKPNDPAENFYAAVGTVAAQKQKDVLVTNPETDINQLLEAWIAFGFTGDVALHQIPILINQFAKKKISRRSFLRLLPIIPSAIVLDSWKNTLDNFSSTFEINKNDKTDNAFLGWSLIDYRDVTSSIGILRWNQHQDIHTQNTRIPMYYGAAHFTPGMQFYLENPEKAEEKLNFYLHYNIGTNRSIRTYSYTNNKWDQIFIQQY